MGTIGQKIFNFYALIVILNSPLKVVVIKARLFNIRVALQKWDKMVKNITLYRQNLVNIRLRVAK